MQQPHEPQVGVPGEMIPPPVQASTGRKLRWESNDKGHVKVALLAGETRTVSGPVVLSDLRWLPALFATSFAQWYREAMTIRAGDGSGAEPVLALWRQRLPGFRRLGGEAVAKFTEQFFDARYSATESAHMEDEETTSVSPDSMYWQGVEIDARIADGLVHIYIVVADGGAFVSLEMDEERFAGRLVGAMQRAVNVLRDALRPDQTPKGGVA